jgi:hypothetical protein
MAKRSRSASHKRLKVPETNPALKDLGVFVGVWDMEISNARFLPSPTATVHGQASFEWTEAGDFLVMRQGNKAAGPPYTTSLIGRDEAADNYVVLYADDRRVSRVYHMRFKDGDWQQWREGPEFFQRFKGTVSKDGNTITASWEMSRNAGETWDHDFDLMYRRRAARSQRQTRTRRAAQRGPRVSK